MPTNIFTKRQRLKMARDLFALVGIDRPGLTDADLLRGAELMRRISQCERVPGSCKRRPAAIAEWQAFLKQKIVDHWKPEA